MTVISTTKRGGRGDMQIIRHLQTIPQETIDASTASKKQDGTIELLVDGLAHGTSGFAVWLRDYCRHLSKYGVNVHIPNVRHSEYPEIAKMRHDPNDPNIDIEMLIYPGTRFHKKNESRIVIGASAFETVKFPDHFKQNVEEVDFLWTISQFCVDRYIQIGIPKKKIALFPCGGDVELFNPYVPPSIKKGENTFGFFNVCGWSARKGIPILLNAYLKEFSRDENVLLFISGGWYAQENAEKEILDIKEEIPKANFPKIVLDWNDLTDFEMPALFNSFDCLCYPALGEGYCKPLAEALSCGIPAISTDAQPMDEIVNKERGYPISIDHIGPEPRCDWICDFYKGADFFHPSEEHLRALMREAFSHPEEAKAKGMRGRDFIKKKHNVSFIIEDVVKRLQKIKNELP